MNLILLVLIAIGSTFGNETTQKKNTAFYPNTLGMTHLAPQTYY